MNSSGNGSIPQANLMASSLDIESAFSESYVAFTAPTLVQQPLIDGTQKCRSILTISCQILRSMLRFHRLGIFE